MHIIMQVYITVKHLTRGHPKGVPTRHSGVPSSQVHFDIIQVQLGAEKIRHIFLSFARSMSMLHSS